MDWEKIATFGLCYLVLFFFFALLASNTWERYLASKETRQNIAAFAEQMSKSRETYRDMMLDTLAALAMQKSQMLVQDMDGNWRLTALDTASREDVRKWLERSVHQAKAAANEEGGAPATEK